MALVSGTISNDIDLVKRFWGFVFLRSGTPITYAQFRPSPQGMFLPVDFFMHVQPTRSAHVTSSTRCCPPTISSIPADHDELFELPARDFWVLFFSVRAHPYLMRSSALLLKGC